MALCGLVACKTPSSTNGASPASIQARAEFRANSGPVRDLSYDEAAGGHILRKHVGQTDDHLRARLERERGITGASTYTDRSTAEHAVGAAIAQSQGKIQRWLYSSGGHPNLVLDYDSEDPIGRTINRGESQSRPCSHALVVLKYGGANDYYVLTSYPECR
jgi:Bacterial CdiA-CT RNAse A domain